MTPNVLNRYMAERMSLLGILGGSLLLLFVLWDAFETIVLPRRVSRRFRLTRLFYRVTWLPWRALARLRKAGAARENFLSVYGPLSLLLLLMLWAAALVFGFALLHGDWEHDSRRPPAYKVLPPTSITAARRCSRLVSATCGPRPPWTGY